MEKLSAAQVKNTLLKVASDMRSVAAELAYEREKRAEAEAELDQLRLEARIRGIAEQMDAKGVQPSTSLEEKVADLRRPENASRLDTLEAALEWEAPQIELAKVAHPSGYAAGERSAMNEAEQRFWDGMMS